MPVSELEEWLRQEEWTRQEHQKVLSSRTSRGFYKHKVDPLWYLRLNDRPANAFQAGSVEGETAKQEHKKAISRETSRRHYQRLKQDPVKYAIWKAKKKLRRVEAAGIVDIM